MKEMYEIRVIKQGTSAGTYFYMYLIDGRQYGAVQTEEEAYEQARVKVKELQSTRYVRKLSKVFDFLLEETSTHGFILAIIFFSLLATRKIYGYYPPWAEFGLRVIMLIIILFFVSVIILAILIDFLNKRIRKKAR